MRQFIILLLFVIVIGAALAAMPDPVNGQSGFVTNTPAADEATSSSTVIPSQQDSSTTEPTEKAPIVPTEAPETEQNSAAEGSFGTGGFATNTPSGPTSTPTLSPTPTIPPSDTPAPTLTPSVTPTIVGPLLYPQGFNSLTGLPFTSEEAMNRRNLIVKISNYPPLVRPQHGVNSADVVVEYEAEGGVTRFAAIFRENAPDHVGSIRSARLLDMELVPIFEALLAYSGTSEPIQQLLLDAEWGYQLISPSIGDNCENAGFCRFPEDGKALEHTLFGDTSMMWEIATQRNVNVGYPSRGFAFSDEPDPDGFVAEDVFIDWYGQTDARWQYDAESGRYLRYTDGVPHFDAADEQQLWIDNLVVLEVEHSRRPDLFPDGSNYESLEVALWDQGRTMVFRDGQYWTGFWRRENREAGTGIQLIYGNNESIKLRPGRTWISIVRGLGDVDVQEELVNLSATATLQALTPTATIDPVAADGQ